jgi:hypothetical protein
MVQMIECLPSKQKDLRSNPSPTKKKKKLCFVNVRQIISYLFIYLWDWGLD